MNVTTVDGSEIRLTTWDVQNLVNNGINYQAQLVNAGFFPSTVSPQKVVLGFFRYGCFGDHFFQGHGHVKTDL